MIDTRGDINNVLSQMRSMRNQMQQSQQQVDGAAQQAQIRPDSLRPDSIADPTRVEETEAPSFGEMFKAAIDTVNDVQKQASDLRTRYELGDTSVDLPEVMIAAQKSSVSFQAMVEVRNKMVEAYKTIQNMPV